MMPPLAEKKRTMSSIKNMLNVSRAESAVESQKKSPRSAPFTHCSQVWREKVCEWCFKVVDRLGEDREIVYTAMNLLDRYIHSQQSSAPKYDRHHYQMASMTAFLIAMKLQGRTQFGINNLIRMGGGAVSREDVARTSRDMIASLSLQKRIHTEPSPAQYIKILQNALSRNYGMSLGGLALETAIFLTELSIFDLRFSNKRTTAVAVAAIKVALELTQPRSLEAINSRLSTFKDLPAFDSHEVADLCFILQRMHRRNPETNCETEINNSPAIIPLDEHSPLIRRESVLLKPKQETPHVVPKDTTRFPTTTKRPEPPSEGQKRKLVQTIPTNPEDYTIKRIRIE